MTEESNKATIVLFSGDMDKAFAAFSIALGAASAGMDTTMFFTFWGVKAIQKGNLTGKGFWGRMLGLMNRGGIETIGPSRFNFGGAGRWLFKNMMKNKNVASLLSLRQMAIDLGVRLLACDTSMQVMEINPDDLIPEVESVCGVGTYIQHAANSKITLFI